MNHDIKTFWQFNIALQDIGAHVWPGGYPTYFVCSDGESLSFEAAKENAGLIRDALITGDTSSQWHVCALTVNWEDPELFCSHDGVRIESAYAEDQAEEREAFTPSELDRFRDAYEEAALWSTSATDENGDTLESLEEYETSIDCHNAFMNDCRAFTDEHAGLIRNAIRKTNGAYTIGNAGHDFWITRNRHGAGFWDRGLGKIGTRLTEAAHGMGSIDLYLSDKGEVEQNGF